MKILLAEDDYIFAETLKVILVQNLSIQMSDIVTVSNYEKAIGTLQTSKIDLIICDLILEGSKTGIDVLEFTNSMNLPIILMTSSEDLSFYQKAKSIKELNYLIKPIHPITLISTIEKVLSEHKQLFLTVKDNSNKYIRIAFDEIKWIESDRNYSTIVSLKKKNTIKVSLTQLIKKLDSRFHRCHHSYIVNIQFLKSITNDTAFIDDAAIPIGRTYKKEILGSFE